MNDLRDSPSWSLVFLSCYRRLQLSHPASHAGFRGVDVMLIGRRFVGVTAYSLNHFSRNSHFVQVGCQSASESVPPVPLPSLLLFYLGGDVVALQVVHPPAQHPPFRGPSKPFPALFVY